MYNFPCVRIVEFEISADELDHHLFLNFNNDLPGKGLRPVFQGALVFEMNGGNNCKLKSHSDMAAANNILRFESARNISHCLHSE
jgi:hypothetical protein